MAVFHLPCDLSWVLELHRVPALAYAAPMPPKAKGENSVSLSQVSNLLNPQICAYRQLLQQQEKSLKSFVQITVDLMNKIMNELISEVQDLKNSLQFYQGEVDVLKEDCSKMTTNCKSTRDDISTVCESLLTKTGKTDYLEGQSRPNNMVVDGMPEPPHNNWTESDEKVRITISEKLQMDHRKIEVERSHGLENL